MPELRAGEEEEEDEEEARQRNSRDLNVEIGGRAEEENL